MKRITEEKDIFIPSPGGDIHAIFTGCASGWGECGYCEPEPGEKPLVVMCHGLMMHAGLNPIREMSDSFAGAGYDTLRIDFRGSGKSSGDIEDMTPLTEVADLLHVIDHIVTCSGDAGGRKIVVCGHSLGGLVSLLASAFLYGAEVPGLGEVLARSSSGEPPFRARLDAMRASLAGLVLLAPAVNIEDDSKAGRVAYETFDPVDIPDKVEVWGSFLSRNYFLTARRLDTFNVISHYTGPACILMGERDRIVELNLSDRIMKAMPGAEMHIIPHGDHLFSRVSRLRAAEIALGFLSELAKSLQ